MVPIHIFQLFFSDTLKELLCAHLSKPFCGVWLKFGDTPDYRHLNQFGWHQLINFICRLCRLNFYEFLSVRTKFAYLLFIHMAKMILFPVFPYTWSLIHFWCIGLSSVTLDPIASNFFIYTPGNGPEMFCNTIIGVTTHKKINFLVF